MGKVLLFDELNTNQYNTKTDRERQREIERERGRERQRDQNGILLEVISNKHLQ